MLLAYRARGKKVPEKGRVRMLAERFPPPARVRTRPLGPKFVPRTSWGLTPLRRGRTLHGPREDQVLDVSWPPRHRMTTPRQAHRSAFGGGGAPEERCPSVRCADVDCRRGAAPSPLVPDSFSYASDVMTTSHHADTGASSLHGKQSGDAVCARRRCVPFPPWLCAGIDARLSRRFNGRCVEHPGDGLARQRCHVAQGGAYIHIMSVPPSLCAPRPLRGSHPPTGQPSAHSSAVVSSRSD